MNITLELMLQLTIVIPLLSTFAIVVTGKSPNRRESVTIASS